MSASLLDGEMLENDCKCNPVILFLPLTHYNIGQIMSVLSLPFLPSFKYKPKYTHYKRYKGFRNVNIENQNSP